MKTNQYSFLQRLLQQMGQGQRAGRVMGASTTNRPKSKMSFAQPALNRVSTIASELPARYADLIDRINPVRLSIPKVGFDTNTNSPTYGTRRKLTQEEYAQELKRRGLINEKALWEK